MSSKPSLPLSATTTTTLPTSSSSAAGTGAVASSSSVPAVTVTTTAVVPTIDTSAIASPHAAAAATASTQSVKLATSTAVPTVSTPSTTWQKIKACCGVATEEVEDAFAVVAPAAGVVLTIAVGEVKALIATLLAHNSSINPALATVFNNLTGEALDMLSVAVTTSINNYMDNHKVPADSALAELIKVAITSGLLTGLAAQTNNSTVESAAEAAEHAIEVHLPLAGEGASDAIAGHS